MGKKGRNIAEVVHNYEKLVTVYDPKAVVYMIGKEDYLSGSEGIPAFKELLKAFIECSLALRDGNGFAVIQTPYAMPDDETNTTIRLYCDAVKEVLQLYDHDEKMKQIIVVHHFEQTNHNEFKTKNLHANGILNAKGHFEIGKQLSMATIGTADGYPGEKVLLNLIPEQNAQQDWSSVPTMTGENLIRKLNMNQKKLQDKMKQKDAMTWLFMGDSITHGAHWTRGYDSIVQLFEKFLKDDLGRTDDIVINTAVSGAYYTDNLGCSRRTVRKI